MTDFIDAATGEILPNTEDNIIVAFALYQNAAALQEYWTKHRYMTEAQKKGIRARLMEAGGMAAWKEALALASKSEFLTGKIIGKTGRFKLDLNFLLRPSAFAKILDNFYTREEPKVALPTLPAPHLKPQPAFVPEPLPVRLAAMIVSYRRHNKYADANRIEDQLAALEKRPAVHVPAPEVAFTSGAAPPLQRSGSAYPPSPARQPPQGPVTDLPGWLDEDIPAEAYGDGA